MIRFLTTLVLLILSVGIQVVLIPVPPPPPAPPERVVPKERVSVFTDIAYSTEHKRHTLDIYRPNTTGQAPVVIFIHGGGWSEGNKNMYAHIGQHYAKSGFCTVVINYRLSPEVRHPSHVLDAAQAFAWVKANIENYQGNPDTIMLVGHSAGAHIACLLASDPVYLGKVGHSPKEVNKVVGVSGVYHIGLMTTLAGYRHVFDGSDKDAASPLAYQPACPVMLIYGSNDYRSMPRQAQAYHDRIVHHGGTCKMAVAPGETHESIIINACLDEKAYSHWILDFLKS